MIKQHIYKNGELQSDIKCQILSFLRVQWPESFIENNRSRDFVSKKEYHPVHFVLSENNLLISYLAVVWKNLKHAKKEYKTYGVSGVFTYPSFRKQGYGLQLVKEAKRYIENSNADITLFTSIHIGFYEKAGFIPMENAKIFEGDPKHPEEVRENVFMLFLSTKGREARKDFETKPIYFGKNIW